MEETDLVNDRVRFYALSMLFFSLPDCLLDLGSEIVAARNLGIPSTYRQVFSLLVEEGVIDQATLRTMSVLVSYRNRLAREWGGDYPCGPRQNCLV